MRREEDAGCGFWICIVFLLPVIFSIIKEIDTRNYKYIAITVLVLITIYFIKEYINKVNRIKSLIDEMSETSKQKNMIIYEKDKLLKSKDKYIQTISMKYDSLYNLIKSKNPFCHAANLYADIKLITYEDSISWLFNKSHRAMKAAAEVGRIKNLTREYIVKCKEMEYKYKFILSNFPELEKYVDDYNYMKNLSNYSSYNHLIDDADEVIGYLSDEEYAKLGVIERNQLALDRYKRSAKSKWTIGMEYEMYIDYLYRCRGFATVPFGVNQGLADLGRDIIAYNGNETHIIQCKNWSANKLIHENVICQLFGTAMEYKIKNGWSLFEEKVCPVLYTTTELSDMAKEFARILKVEVYVCKMGDFPMIKGNINRGKKIYHLPFDQQYYNTQINKEGEEYFWTVKDAVKKGFVRARRYFIKNN